MSSISDITGYYDYSSVYGYGTQTTTGSTSATVLESTLNSTNLDAATDDELMDVCTEECKKLDWPLVLLALGPTATVMAKRLSEKGIQAIDIGLLDICYEISLRCDLGNDVPVPRDNPVPGKFTAEAPNGNVVEDCTDPVYLEQIVYRTN